MAVLRSRYTTVAIVLHWTIAAAIIFQIILGWRMGDLPRGPASFAMFQLHKSIGITVLLLSLARLGWRLVNPVPLAPPGQPRWERVASRLVHGGFYLIMIALPLTGWLLVSTSRIQVPTLLYGMVPWPHIPGLRDLAPASREAWHEASEFGHEWLVYLTLALLFLHLGAVAKHQLIDRDDVFARMAPGARPGWGEPRQWLAGVALLALVGFGYSYMPEGGTAAPPPPAVPASAPTADAGTAAADVLAPPSEQTAAAVENVAEATPVAAEPVAWKIEGGSSLGFVASWSGQSIIGRFDRWDGDILFAPDALAGSSIRVTIDLASVSTGDGQRDASLAGADWFDTATHPKAVFSATDFKKTGKGRYSAGGTLHLRGVKKPVALAFSLAIKGDTATAKGSATLDRTQFGVGQGEWASTEQIAGPVQVNFALTARRSPDRSPPD